MRAVFVLVALGYFFYLPRAALWCPLKALPFPIPPLMLGVFRSPSCHSGALWYSYALYHTLSRCSRMISRS